MVRKRVVPVTVAMAVVASAGALVLTAGPAAAAPVCQETNANKSCVAVDYEVGWVKSIRVNGQCLQGVSGHYPGARVDRWSTPTVQTYGGRACEGGTLNAASSHWTTEGQDGYRWVLIWDGSA